MDKQNWFIDGIIFKHPFTCILAGPTGAGKTVLLQNILEHKNKIIDAKPDKIVYCYKTWQPAFDEIFNSTNKEIEFNQGLYNIELFDKTKNNMLIIDDLMGECENNQDIKQLVAVDSHHSNISVFLISQNIFPNFSIYTHIKTFFNSYKKQ
jgi:Cdc6-like AAA superfamily ATPase